jgi:hypothetical protein
MSEYEFPQCPGCYYRSVRYRSEGEADTASFFDLVERKFAYEKIQGKSYLLDFNMWNPDGEELFIEKKSVTTTAELAQHEERVYSSMDRWENHILLTGIAWNLKITDERCPKADTLGYTAAISQPKGFPYCGCWIWAIFNYTEFSLWPHCKPLPKTARPAPKRTIKDLTKKAHKNVKHNPQTEELPFDWVADPIRRRPPKEKEDGPQR